MLSYKEDINLHYVNCETLKDRHVWIEGNMNTAAVSTDFRNTAAVSTDFKVAEMGNKGKKLNRVSSSAAGQFPESSDPLRATWQDVPGPVWPVW